MTSIAPSFCFSFLSKHIEIFMSNIRRFPVLFISHGTNPLTFLHLESRDSTEGQPKPLSAALWFRQLPGLLNVSKAPKGIVVISADWETSNVVQITSHDQETQLYPDAPRLNYNPPGDLNLSRRVQSLLHQSVIPSELNEKRGFDHGVLLPMKSICPDGDIPIVELSILDHFSPSQHIAIGKALAPLRNEEILIIGSGSIVHGNSATIEQVNEFIDCVTDVQSIHPRDEHFIPLHVVIGAAQSDRGEWFNREVLKTQATFIFGN